MAVEKKVQQVQKMQIREAEQLQTHYANFARISAGLYDFIFSFGRIYPPVDDSQELKAEISCEIIMSPQHAFAFYRLLEENIKEYKKEFGNININTPSEDSSGS